MALKSLIEKYLLLILLIIPLFILLILRFVFHFDGLFGQDAYEYERYARELNDYYISGNKPAEMYWPVNYSWLGSVLIHLFPQPGFALQLISAIGLSFAGYFSIKLICLLNKINVNSVFPYVVVILFFSPYVFRNSFAAMPDVMTAALITAAIYYSVLFYKSSIPGYYFIFCLLFAFAFFTKYASAVILITPFVYGFILFFKWKPAYLFLIPLLFFMAVLPELFLKKEITGFTEMLPDLQWSFINFFKNSFTTQEGSSDYLLPGIVYAFENIFHPGFIFAGAFLIIIPVIKRKQIIVTKEQLVFLIVPVILFALFLGGIPRQNDRFLIPSFPLIVILFFSAWQIFLAGIKKLSFRISIIVFCLLMNITLTIYAFKGIYSRNQFEQNAAKDIIESENKLIYTFEADVALKARGYHGYIINLWGLDIHSYSVGALVLINEKNIESQWKSRRPEKNLFILKQNYQLELINKYSGDWKLYKIKRRK